MRREKEIRNRVDLMCCWCKRVRREIEERGVFIF